MCPSVDSRLPPVCRRALEAPKPSVLPDVEAADRTAVPRNAVALARLRSTPLIKSSTLRVQRARHHMAMAHPDLQEHPAASTRLVSPRAFGKRTKARPPPDRRRSPHRPVP